MMDHSSSAFWPSLCVALVVALALHAVFARLLLRSWMQDMLKLENDVKTRGFPLSRHDNYKASTTNDPLKRANQHLIAKRIEEHLKEWRRRNPAITMNISRENHEKL